VGDVLLVGKFRNRRAMITGFSSDENNQPVAQTDKGEHKIFKPRIAKLMPAKDRLKESECSNSLCPSQSHFRLAHETEQGSICKFLQIFYSLPGLNSI